MVGRLCPPLSQRGQSDVWRLQCPPRPLTVYMIGVYRTFAAPDRTGNGPWPMMLLYGAVMMAATDGLQETFYAMLALHGGAGLAVRRCRDRSCRAARR